MLRALTRLSLLGMALGAGLMYYVVAAFRIGTNLACTYPMTAEHSVLNYLLLGSRCTLP
jgi:hypothetical protein